jgi:hypothetical protein
MTSEIAVMNQRAIALAADSAVTLIDGGKIIVRNDQKKLFNLVDGVPVGVMYFGMADIMGHPWDVLLEHYRKTAPAGALPHLGDHAESFLTMLDGLERFFPPDRHKDEYRRLFVSVLRFVFRLAHYLYETGTQGPDEELLRQAISLVYERYHNHADGTKRRDLPCFPDGFADRVARDYGAVADDIIAYSFSAFPLDKSARDQLKEIAVLCVVKDLFLEDVTWLVFAGYGAEDNYPTVLTYHVSAVVGGIVKRSPVDDVRIDGHTHSAVAIYAESAATYAFLRGIELELEAEICDRTQAMAYDLVNRVVDSCTGVDPVQREAIRRQFQSERIPQALSQWYDGIGAFQQEAYVKPMLAVIEIATRQELAETAQDLVALNILKKRLTAQSQTVGGAIDVAIISRDSGFSWWKRQGG